VLPAMERPLDLYAVSVYGITEEGRVYLDVTREDCDQRGSMSAMPVSDNYCKLGRI